MKAKLDNYEFSYTDNNPFHHQAYLMPPVLKMLSNLTISNHQKPFILDIGCGNGSLSNLIAQQGYQVVGIDESKQGINIARQSFPNCQFIQKSIYDLPDSEFKNAFDIVIAIEVIEHLIYPRELLKAAQQYLKPTGRLILTTPYHGYFKNITLALAGKCDQHFNPLWDGGHVKFFSVSTLTTLLKSENFTDIKYQFAGRIPFLWKSMLCSSAPFIN
ncbi:MAG TPA: class I SAM-dependent methyltransferase [Halomicronema sp.]